MSEFYKSEKNFRRFESSVLRIIEHYPRSVEISADGLAPTTVVARLRDAVASVIRETEWETDVDRERLKEIRKDIAFVIRGNTIIAGLRAQVCLPPITSLTQDAPVTRSNDLPRSFNPTTPDQLTAFNVLISDGFIPGIVIPRVLQSWEISLFSKCLVEVLDTETIILCPQQH